MLIMFKKYWIFTKKYRRAWILAVEVAVSALLVIMTLSAFVYLAEDIFSRETIVFDQSATILMRSLKTPGLTNIMIAVTEFASAPAIAGFSAILLIYLYQKRRKDALIYCGILFTGILLNLLLKNMFVRARPPLPLILETGYSFPSGHAMNGFIFYTSLAYFLYRESKSKLRAMLAAIFSSAMILVIGFSRVYLGVHYLSDVVAGYLAGFVWFTSAIVFEKTIIYKRLFSAVKRKL